MSQIKLGSKVSHRDDIMTAELHGNLVMMNIDRGHYYGIETVGAQIWNLLAEPIVVADLIDHLTTLYSSDQPETIADDTVAFLGELFAEELIVLHE